MLHILGNDQFGWNELKWQIYFGIGKNYLTFTERTLWYIVQ